MIRKTVPLVATAAMLAALAACSTSGAPVVAASDTRAAVKIGVVGAAQGQWAVFAKKAQAAGIDVEIVDFVDGAELNAALSAGQVDLNQFQELKELSEYNVSAKDNLVPIGSTAIYPLAVYSKKYKSVAAIPAGAEIAVPDEPTDLARALLVLQDAGLLALRDGGTAYSRETDVLPGSKVTVTPVAADRTTTVLSTLAASVVENDFVGDAGLTAAQALHHDDAATATARPYVNVWAARAVDKANPTYLKLVAISHDPEVEAAVKADSGGVALIATQPGAELTKRLKVLQSQFAAVQAVA